MSVVYIMEDDLFSRLERRPVPQPKKEFTVNAPKGMVQQRIDLNVEVKDLTGENLFDRKEFEERLKRNEPAPKKTTIFDADPEEPPIDPFQRSTEPSEKSIMIKPKKSKKLSIKQDIDASDVAIDAPGKREITTTEPVTIKVKGKIDKRLVLKPGNKSILSKGTITGMPQFQTVKQKRTTPAPDFESISLETPAQVNIGKVISKRLPPPVKEISVLPPRFYLNNREIFIDFMDKVFSKYSEQLAAEETDAPQNLTKHSFNAVQTNSQP